MMNITTVAKAIEERLSNSTSQFTSFEMKKGGEIKMEKSFSGVYEVYFSNYGQLAMTSDINEVAEWFINYPAKAEELVAEDEAYFAENEPQLGEYFNTHFAGKDWDEIRNDEELYDCWGYYSDWHKDVYGYRPHGIVCGVYINPHAC